MTIVNQVVLDRMKFGVQQMLPGELVAEIQYHEDFLTDQLALRLKTEVLGKNQTQGQETVRFHVPLTWFDAWLQQTWLGRKVARWRRPRMHTREITIHWQRMLLLPHWAQQLPPSAGPVVVYEPRTFRVEDIEDPYGTY